MFTRANPTANPKALALGLVSWTYEPEIAAVALAPTSQTIYFCSIWLPAGVPINNIFTWNTVAGSGTTPTGIYLFLDNGSSVVAQSANLAANASWTSGGIRKFPIPTYTPLASAYHRVCYLSNGVFGTTPLQLGNRTTAGISAKGDLVFEPWGTGGTAQTIPPANASALPTVAVTVNAPWFGVGS